MINGANTEGKRDKVLVASKGNDIIGDWVKTLAPLRHPRDEQPLLQVAWVVSTSHSHKVSAACKPYLLLLLRVVAELRQVAEAMDSRGVS